MEDIKTDKKEKKFEISYKYLRTEGVGPESEFHASGYEDNPIAGVCNKFNARKNGGEPVYIMQHHTVYDYNKTIDSFTANKGDESWNWGSAHYVINDEGNIDCVVHPDYRAYHAGLGYFIKESKLNPKGLVPKNDMNSWSIGIENVNDGYTPFTTKQMHANIDLMELLKTYYKSIDTKMVLGHGDWDSTRKCDPNPYFDWELAANASKQLDVKHNFGVYPTTEYKADSNEIISGTHPEFASKESIEEVQKILAEIGYNVFSEQDANLGELDNVTMNCIKAFKNHYMNKAVVENLKDFGDYEHYANHNPFMIEVTDNTMEIMAEVADLFSE